MSHFSQIRLMKRLYCGHENAIEVLDFASPGPDASERLKTVSTKREKGGQRGIISALAFSPDYSGLYAAGSFSGTVSLYTEDTGATPVQHIDGVAFHPLNPQTMFVASRRSNVIQVFDIRDTSRQLSELKKVGASNQRLWFDVDPWGRYLGSGDETGEISVWNLSDLSTPIIKEKLHDVPPVHAGYPLSLGIPRIFATTIFNRFRYRKLL
ncbi:MAG: hypothetical protein TREMPRED_003271 [Tremellales sp. Tagirdzhanova-0007]|nr:MAG: hypothetical protein TREMPRED_003271 [Tremellales sp. Tagirdzhanova-0007]